MVSGFKKNLATKVSNTFDRHTYLPPSNVAIPAAIDTEASYPYEANDGNCRFNRTNVGATDTGFVDIPAGNETALQIALATVGPIAVTIAASQPSFQFYSSGVYNEPACSKTELDHPFFLVGYDTATNGTFQQDYYIAKNSWGETWGNKGYIWMSRNKDNQC
ncbi:unnamed protein product, partial [Didymodactylos carnosus]